jgi:GPH family glycoside/pentoside/hexuronide:cation symporter
MKFGWGIGGALAGYLLAAFGYVANVAQTEQAITGIKLMMTVFPGLLYILAAVLLIFYNIDPETARRMKAALDARREAEESAEA